MPDCITYFFVKGERKPTTGYATPPRVTPELTPLIPDPDGEINWGLIGAQGRLRGQLGVQRVQRFGTGEYMVDLTAPRIDDRWIISRFADGQRPLIPNSGPYSLIEDEDERKFMIKWYDRSGSPLDLNFVFGVYG